MIIAGDIQGESQLPVKSGTARKGERSWIRLARCRQAIYCSVSTWVALSFLLCSNAAAVVVTFTGAEPQLVCFVHLYLDVDVELMAVRSHDSGHANASVVGVQQGQFQCWS